MKIILPLLLILAGCQKHIQSIADSEMAAPSFFSTSDSRIQIVGRVDDHDKSLPRVYASGAYMEAVFVGPTCSVILNDEHYLTNQNYITTVVDDDKPVRMKLKGYRDTIVVATGLSGSLHHLIVCKETESSQGYVEYLGIICSGLKALTPEYNRKMMFFGDSQTVGSCADITVPYDLSTRYWYEYHDAYGSYGPTTARLLSAQWQIQAMSGIGLTRSCCKSTVTMPMVYDKLCMYNNTGYYDLKRYIPDVITICLGQNDGPADSAKFCTVYIDFIRKLQHDYPNAKMVCLGSPMADAYFKPILDRRIKAVVSTVNNQKVSWFTFSTRYAHGYSAHPSDADHAAIAAELSVYIRKLTNW